MWLVGKSKYVLGCEHFKYNLYPKLIRGLRCAIYSSFKKIIVLTEKDRLKFSEHLPDSKVITIPNMAVVNESFELNLQSKTIIAVGRLHPQKGFDLLISASKAVFSKHPDWTLNIFGEGELSEVLSDEIKKNDLGNFIFLKGYSNHLNEEFAQSAFFVLSSRYEGFPMVLVEALSIGMPSVAFDCPEGPAQLLAEGGGILVENGNIEKLADAMNYMIEHPEYRHECANYRNVIKKNLSPEVVYEKWLKVF